MGSISDSCVGEQALLTVISARQISIERYDTSVCLNAKLSDEEFNSKIFL